MSLVVQMPLLPKANAHSTQHLEAIKDSLENVRQVREDVITNLQARSTLQCEVATY